MKQINHWTLALAPALAFGLAAAPAAAADMTWDMPNEYNDTSIHAEADKVFAAKLAELSGGAIEIVHHFGGSIGYKSKDQLDAVADGAVPLANTFVGPLGGIEPMFLLPSLPFLAATVEDARRLYETAKPAYSEVFASNGQVLLYASPWPPSGIWAKQPADSVAAISGLKIRTYDASGTITLAAAGASPIQLSWADVVPQLSTGGIDAVLTSAEGGANAKFWEHVSHFTEVNYAMPLNMVHMNADVFNGLSAEQKQAVLDAAKAAEDFVWTEVASRTAKNYADMQANGMTVVTGVPEDYLAALNEAGQAARTEWLEKTGPKGQAILDAYLATN